MRTSSIPRHGRQPLEPILLLSLLVFLSLVFIRTFFRDTRPIVEQLYSAIVGALQCFGVFLGLIVLLASAEMIKQAAARARSRRLSRHLAWLSPWRADGRLPATRDDVTRLRTLLDDGDDAVRRNALDALFSILRASPSLASTPRLRSALLQVLAREPGFTHALMARPGEALLPIVTLGAKLGAGTSDKRLAPPTDDSSVLAAWVHANRDPEQIQEVQVSIGFDTSSLPAQEDRARFIGLWLFIAGTDLGRFQAIDRRPRRDPNAAYGLIIRGDLVEVRCPGQSRGHRLDYVFPLPSVCESTLARLFLEIQALNLGLLAACVEDSCRILLPGDVPSWLDRRCRAVAAGYRRFERRLVAFLRRHDRYRDPDAIHLTDTSDDDERRRAVRRYRLEEALYPQRRWIVPLYDPDTSWDRLVMPLRAIEGMLLHQGESEGGRTRGAEFIRQARQLGKESSDEILLATANGDDTPDPPPDPFLDVSEEEASVHYLSSVRRAIDKGAVTLEQLPDPSVFMKAEAYYASTRDRESEP